MDEGTIGDVSKDCVKEEKKEENDSVKLDKCVHVKA